MAKPTLFTWATDSTYSAGAFSWSGQSNKVAPAAGLIAQGYAPKTKPTAQVLNRNLNLIGQWIAYLNAGVFENDVTIQGNLTVTGTTTLGGNLAVDGRVAATGDVYHGDRQMCWGFGGAFGGTTTWNTFGTDAYALQLSASTSCFKFLDGLKLGDRVKVLEVSGNSSVAGFVELWKQNYDTATLVATTNVVSNFNTAGMIRMTINNPDTEGKLAQRDMFYVMVSAGGGGDVDLTTIRIEYDHPPPP